MDRILDLVRQTPPFTRYWCASIIVAGAITHFKVMSPAALAFIPEKTFNGQPWRLITSFCFRNGLSLMLFLKVYMVSVSLQSYEGGYSTKEAIFPKSFAKLLAIKRQRLLDFANTNKTIDYLYFVFQIWLSIVIVNTIGYYKYNFRVVFPGEVMDEILLYIDCRSRPNIIMNVMGLFDVRVIYLPVVYFIFNYVLSGNLLADLAGILTGNFENSFKGFERDVVWMYLMIYVLGHFWWYMREYLMQYVYYDLDRERSNLRGKAMDQYGVNRVNFIREALVVLVLPPWYWVVAGR